MSLLILFSGFIFLNPLFSQIATREEVVFYTAEWSGDRYPDGRPKVSDELLERIKNISIEEAWGVLRGEGYFNQFEGNWEMIHEDKPFTGRALTAVYIPESPGLQRRMLDKGHAEGMIGASNSWPIDMLQEGDVYVADCFGKIIDGTLIGDNLGNAIYTNSHRGVVFDGGARDLEGLENIEGFNAFVRGFDPSFLRNVMLTGINVPVRIGEAVVLPGDVVLAKREGVIFIPAHLAEKVAITAEFIMLRDMFGHQRLKEGTYTPGQIDGRWSDEIKQDFLKWLDGNPDLLPMTREELDEFMKNRTW
ncbi:MAG: dimethylmenaquinone methyltransferase [Bacteroides sp. SM23_62_1]|nr:MAG: dimethylmenaquinone methyltransferase [Bacteroides sp. SM23_62_1]